MKASTGAALWRAYQSWTLAVAIALVAFIGAFNVFVDPLGIFGSPRIPGLNAQKPYLDHHRELARMRGGLRQCPSAGIFGNSRAEIGFDPAHPAFAAHGLTAYNFAIPGSGDMLALRELQWLKGAGCMPKTIILGVEFFDFLGGARPRPESELLVKPLPTIDTEVLAETALSVTALRDSITTLMIPHTSYPAILTERGFNPLYNYIPEVERSGHYLLFRQRAEENVRRWSRQAKQLHPTGGSVSEDEQVLSAILQLAVSSGSSVYLVIYPYHAEIRLLMERLELGELFSQWKQSLLEISARVPAAEGQVELWDFSGISQRTLEVIPSAGDRHSRMNFYWEAGHFKKELGDQVISRVFGEENGFGMKVEAASVSAWLSQDREGVRDLLNTPSKLLSEVDSVVGTQRGHK